MKVKFSGYVNFPGKPPDDRGSIDNWLATAISKAVKKGEKSETGLEHLSLLHIEWDLERPPFVETI